MGNSLGRNGKENRHQKAIQIFARISRNAASHFQYSKLNEVTTRDVAEFLNSYVANGRVASVKLIRSRIVDLFREAIAAGHIDSNPAEATKNPRVTVKRERLTLDEFIAIRSVAEKQSNWFHVVMDLALVTAQRLGDLRKMSWDDIVDDKLWVTQQKTGMKLAIPLSIKLDAVDLSLRDVIDKCKLNKTNDNRIIAKKRVSSLTNLSDFFAKFRNEAGIDWKEKPPTFHEIRSLSARLYVKEKGGDFAQSLLGHKSSAMTDKYRDSRGKDWIIINE